MFLPFLAKAHIHHYMCSYRSAVIHCSRPVDVTLKGMPEI
jgi:hypothetical protein